MTYEMRLSSIPVFQFISSDDATEIAKFATMVEKAAGETIVVQGQDVMGLYIVAEGRVSVYSGELATPLGTIEVGGEIGEMSLIENAKASATIRADFDPTKLIFIHRNAFKSHIEGKTSLAAAFFRGVAVSLSRKLRTTTQRASDELARLHKMILGLSHGGTSNRGDDLSRIPAALGVINASVRNSYEQAITRLGQASDPDDAARILREVVSTMQSDAKVEVAKLAEVSQRISEIVQRIQGLETMMRAAVRP